MPQLTNVVLTDRAATPVNHTFKPENITGGVATLTESSGVPIGNNRLTVSLTRTKENGRYKPSLRCTFPVLQNETINGVSRPIVVRSAYADVTFSFDSSSTTQERKDAVGMVYSALASGNAMINSVLVDLEGIY